ncbi:MULTISPECIES: WXG100 family type VII secretion target [Streptomyces]|uniref:Excreted virulence factor EspC, type VII ESX diderm n=1 Tax=Streptomyces pini TaxID=1520580 RepID=A0A1I4K1P3_9ACTN|nr:MULTISPECIES: type VII secretion target [Streptomyces]SFL72433.1 Excreted virulence factor EspC, type VII ESX diderm [Streptomyces pini]
MSFDEEWDQLVAKATREQATRTRLNTLDGDEGGGGTTKLLHVTPNELTKRAGRTDTIRGNFADADNAVIEKTKEVPGGLKGFKSATAFTTFQERWEEQMKYLQGLLDSGVAKPLRAAAGELQQEDGDRAKVIDGLKMEDGKGSDK